ncbi:sugar ABC transporter ATP-binding protein [Microbacterium sp. LWH7-1.2]|uniref:sugar ABC transporter ATP-binding protein n=1 Tax=Microbacterium sp. LWH7-1.2 TaxID=3135257 RepID=UPI0031388131
MSTLAIGEVAAFACRDLTKSYGPVQVLAVEELTIRPGSIHALIGQNGAGKSTCLSMLAGRVQPTSGSIAVFGDQVDFRAPHDALRAGISAIYQELSNVPTLTTQANLHLGDELRNGPFLDERAMRRELQRWNEYLGVSIPPNVVAGRLSVAEQQLLEIMRALHHGSRILLLDEPTASLSLTESRRLLDVMKELRSQGTTLVLVSHHLDDVLEVADDITVFREGRVALESSAGERRKSALVSAMLGAKGVTEEAAESEQISVARRHRPSKEVLRVEGLTVEAAVEEISFSIEEGELVGLGGLVGSGRSTILRALMGLGKRTGGRMWIDGQEVRWPRSPRAALRLGIGMIPESRKSEGLLLGASAATNIALPRLRGATRSGGLTRRSLRDATAPSALGAGYDPGRLDQRAGTLSGGNQQKLLLARWDFTRLRVLLADEPTRGIDIGAKATIISNLEARAASGQAVLFASAEMEEVTALCSRALVLNAGRLAGELHSSDEPITADAILALAFGTEQDAETS